MSLKSRMKKLEQVHGGTEPEVSVFITHFEDRDGNVNEEKSTVFAFVNWGPGRFANVGREDGESIAEFEARLDCLKQLTWEQAKDQYDIHN